MTERSIAEKVFQRVEALQDEMVQLISEIIQIPSINPYIDPELKDERIGGETKVNQHLQPVMDAIGLETDLWEVEKGRANLVGVLKGKGDGNSLIFNGHVDTVATGPAELWTIAEPFSGKVLDGKIYGRGATDMKSADVCTIYAVKALLEAGVRPKGDVILQMVSGEEMMQPEIGTLSAIERGYRADAAIVVEPSAPPYHLGILTASPGVLILEISVKGKSAHTSMRDEIVRAGGRGMDVAVSAIEKGMLIYNALLKLEQEWGQSKSHPVFTRPGHFTICPTTFASGLEGLAFIPAKCSMTFVVWHAPQDTKEQVIAEITKCIELIIQTDPWLRDNPPVLDWQDGWWWPPYDLPVDTPICRSAARAYEHVMGEPAKYYGFTAVDDATFLNQSGIPAITLGPGSIEIAHTANEHIVIEELITAVKIFALTIVDWCGV